MYIRRQAPLLLKGLKNMKYNSTTDKGIVVSASQAIAQGISNDGGLFVPMEIPQYALSEIEALTKLDYRGRAKKILADYLDDFTSDEIAECVDKAYTKEKFGGDNPAPIAYEKFGDIDMNILELWHGPTSAFKDMALQILPHLLTKSLKKTTDKEAVILVATSGDTGKAALEGFRDVDGTKIMVFYPVDGVSPMQKRQMTTQEGSNVAVCAIKGNFDDAQTGVKRIFTDAQLVKTLSDNGYLFSSANSINWGRLLPQIVYYFSAYCDMVNDGRITLGDKINVAVPTGNFGNILACYYAFRMGLPVNKFICASNSNNVLTDFITTGTYDKNRSFYATISPSMDILVSSNLERFLYHMTDKNDAQVKEWMTALKTEGVYTVDDATKAKIKEIFVGGYCSEEKTREIIGTFFNDYGYLCDTHTAVAVSVYKDYVEKTGDRTPTIVDSTASPYKFSKSVLEAVAQGEELPRDEFEMVELLSAKTNTAVPAPLAALRSKQTRFDTVRAKEEMADFVLSTLGVQ